MRGKPPADQPVLGLVLYLEDDAVAGLPDCGHSMDARRWAPGFPFAAGRERAAFVLRVPPCVEKRCTVGRGCKVYT